MKQYYADAKLKRKIQKMQYKKHPKWAKRRWVRRILLLIGPIGLVMSYFNITYDDSTMFTHDGVEGLMRITTAVGLGMFASIPYLPYLKILETSGASVTYYREHDTVLVIEEDIKYIYHPSNQLKLLFVGKWEMRKRQKKLKNILV